MYVPQIQINQHVNPNNPKIALETWPLHDPDMTMKSVEHSMDHFWTMLTQS